MAVSNHGYVHLSGHQTVGIPGDGTIRTMQKYMRLEDEIETVTPWRENKRSDKGAISCQQQ